MEGPSKQWGESSRIERSARVTNHLNRCVHSRCGRYRCSQSESIGVRSRGRVLPPAGENARITGLFTGSSGDARALTPLAAREYDRRTALPLGHRCPTPPRHTEMKPILIAVDDQPGRLETIRRELLKRYAEDYDVACEPSPRAALERLEALRAAGAEVLVMLAAVEMEAMTGAELLERAHELHPRAWRVLVLPHGTRAQIKPVLRIISQGRVDRYALLPSCSPDEQFHHLVAELLHECQR